MRTLMSPVLLHTTPGQGVLHVLPPKQCSTVPLPPQPESPRETKGYLTCCADTAFHETW